MKNLLIWLSIIIFASCNANSSKESSGTKIKYPSHKLPAFNYDINKEKNARRDDTSSVDQQLDAFANYYIVVADTGTNYYKLREKMTDLHESLRLSIDTMGRYYNKSKDLIALPDNDSDEIYAGDYFPRRQPSKNLSLEYLAFYKPGSNKKTIALVAGVYENKASADSLMKIMATQNEAFTFKAKVYVGCIH